MKSQTKNDHLEHTREAGGGVSVEPTAGPAASHAASHAAGHSGSHSGGSAAGSQFPQRHPEYALYKPNLKGSGAVVRFSLNKPKGALFVDAAPQSGEKQFDWEKKITMKWSTPDLGAVLATLQGRTPQTKLFHQSEKSNSTFEFTRREDGVADRAPYTLVLSRQDAQDKSVRKHLIPVTHAEAAILETCLRTAVGRLLGW